MKLRESCPKNDPGDLTENQFHFQLNLIKYVLKVHFKDCKILFQNYIELIVNIRRLNKINVITIKLKFCYHILS